MELPALVLSLLAVVAGGLLWRRHARLAGRLDETSREQVAAYEQLESAIRQTRRDLELTLDRVRTVEKDRTALARSVEELANRLSAVEMARTKTKNDLAALVDRVRTLETDRTQLKKRLAEAERSIRDNEDRLVRLKSRDPSEMPAVPRAELQLSDAVREIQAAVYRT